ncbi:pyridoxamine 5'-phosphate oxidase family protein [Candidatus Obscuribacterales bacterium]|nr:pyridoxamine 5'-phosphate oxidase family protein [Candidatus Obscuribacterales bacterium]MBX3150840.1 pyridoxamine 5'-phosphate oxidase family protein [Candidatus Obscuribacterales bacterium]
MFSDGPFHEGELDIQERTGERDIAMMNSVAVKSEILGGALNFIDRQPLIVVASEDSNGDLWASMLFGKPGFMHAPSTRELHIDLTQSVGIEGDPLLTNISDDRRVGTLLIELDTRRRLKINGRVSIHTEEQLLIAVEESFPLCPKYIQRRKVRLPDDKNAILTTSLARGTTLGAEEIALIKSSDTMFAATSNPEGNLDISHRGGKQGFVSVVDGKQLRVPDFPGNSMFNSFGNLQLNDKTGVIILDFAARQSLQISGRAAVLLDQEDPNGETGGTNRFWTLDIEHWQRATIPALELEFIDASPFNPK